MNIEFLSESFYYYFWHQTNLIVLIFCQLLICIKKKWCAVSIVFRPPSVLDCGLQLLITSTLSKCLTFFTWKPNVLNDLMNKVQIHRILLLLDIFMVWKACKISMVAMWVVCCNEWSCSWHLSPVISSWWLSIKLDAFTMKESKFVKVLLKLTKKMFSSSSKYGGIFLKTYAYDMEIWIQSLKHPKLFPSPSSSSIPLMLNINFNPYSPQIENWFTKFFLTTLKTRIFKKIRD